LRTQGIIRGVFSGVRWRPSPRKVDVGMALVVSAVVLWGCHSESDPSAVGLSAVEGHPVTPAPAWAYLLVAAAGLALIWRRTHPRAVLAASLVGVLTFTALGYVGDAALVIPPIALFSVAQTASAREAMAFGIATVLAVGGVILLGPVDHLTSGDIGLIGLVAVAALGGIAAADRRRYVEAVRARSELVERAHREEARRKVDAERLRIARDLHDVVAHTMSTINVQAGAATYLADDLPPSAADALEAIRAASKDGLRELRAILAVLRQVDDAESNQPQPGLGRLDALVAGVGAAGLPTTVVTTGCPPVVLPPAVDLAAYRIIQESLTNVIRHAGPATATVHISYGSGEVGLRITDTGAGPPATTTTSGGHGLVGMRERAVAAGGDLAAGRTRGGGFQVSARLPIGS
jgi:signal transduction histidine kinase